MAPVLRQLAFFLGILSLTALMVRSGALQRIAVPSERSRAGVCLAEMRGRLSEPAWARTDYELFRLAGERHDLEALDCLLQASELSAGARADIHFQILALTLAQVGDELFSSRVYQVEATARKSTGELLRHIRDLDRSAPKTCRALQLAGELNPSGPPLSCFQRSRRP